MKRSLLILLVLFAIAAIGGYFFVNNAYTHNYDGEFPVNRSYTHNYDGEFPVKGITINADSAMIAHGRYLALGPAHCQHCHSSFDNAAALERGEEVPLTGGFAFELPFGKIYARNISSDPETGIGAMSDGQIYRMLRHNIKANGKVTIEFMPFFNMSEYDVKCVIAYIRTVKPVKNVVPENTFNLMGKAIMGLTIKPSQPNGTPPEYVKQDSTSEYGQYLAFAVANCYGCHTERNLQTGEYTGDPYAGGFKFGPDALTKGWTFVSPNITTDPETGVIANWSEEQFVARMRGGRVHPASPMPWGPFSRMDDIDLKAIYRFLQTVKPAKRDNGQIATPPADA